MAGNSCVEQILPPDTTTVSKLRRNLVSWYERNGRVYPWRENPSKYNLVIAELMLRRTKADQVEPVFQEFISRYPDSATLAQARRSSVTKLTKPLGLNWRNDTFVSMARKAVSDFSGEIPETRDQIMQLPGVGDYVAGAVLSVSLNKPEWIVDSNIARFFVRYFGVQTGSEARRNPMIIEIARRYARCRNPRRANLALIDYSSLVCSPSSPLCNECHLRECLVGGEDEF